MIQYLGWTERSLPLCGILAGSEKAIAEASTVAKASAKVGKVIIYDTVSCSRKDNNTGKHRWQTESVLPFN